MHRTASLWSVVALRAGFGLCAFVGLRCHAQPVQVAPGGASLRATASATAYELGRAPGGGTLDAIAGIRSEWVAVRAAGHVSVWIYADLVRDGVVVAQKVSIRSGPGLAYEGMGELPKGQAVTVLGSQGDWLRIEPPSGLQVWVNRRDLVVGAGGRSESPSVAGTPQRVPPPPSDTPPPVPSMVQPRQHAAATNRVAASVPRIRLTTPTPAPGAPVAAAQGPERTSVPPAAATAGDGAAVSARTSTAPVASVARPVPIPSGAVKGATVQVNGTLRPVGFMVLRRPSSYRLVAPDERGQPVTVCYVVGVDASQLDALMGRTVRLSGRRYELKGVKHPLVAAERIEVD